MEPATGLVIEEPAIVRATIAHAILDSAEQEISQIGQVALRLHQVSAVSRIQASLAEFRCALLCDPVGTGKTYTALAVAAGFRSVLIIAPAVLKSMWRECARRAGLLVRFASFESLSRGHVPSGRFDFVIVDEAHHARNPKTRRYKSLAEIARGGDVLLLSATPIHNSRRDLLALLSICLGNRARRLSTAALARCVIRRDALMTSLTGMPMARPLVWCTIRESARIPALLMSLPPPVPPKDGGDGGVLLTHSLIRQWSSSDAALCGALRRRLVRAESLIAALRDGAWPSRLELESWIAGNDSVQLALPGVLAPVTGNHDDLIRQVGIHRDAVREVISVCSASVSDVERADLIRRIRAGHSDRRIVVFSQFADSVSGMFGLLVNDGGVAALSGSSASVAGGTISRDKAIFRFAPRASGRPEPPRSQAVTLLLTTDILSEGVNLQDAGVVIHLDLPWTPARMEQRLGRVARIGSRHHEVISYALAPPMESQELVRIDAILRAKMEEAGAVSGRFESLGSFASLDNGRSIPAVTESIRRMLNVWRMETFSPDTRGIPASAVESAEDGFLAVCADGQHRFLVVSQGGEVSDDVACIESVLSACEGIGVRCSPNLFKHAQQKIGDWLYARSCVMNVQSASDRTSSSIRHALRRIDRAVKTANTAQRAHVASVARKAREMLATQAGAHLEKEIGRMAMELDSDIELVHRLSALEIDVRGRGENRKARVLAMLLLVQTTPVSRVRKS